ncbi:hypothetical protein [Pseudomonas sp. nanlin1]|uniref:hypothetical protein n=1 Tax=Pseudomonas sp. nanlin1 TaxID=3040605 RepID=UPI00388EA0DA
MKQEHDLWVVRILPAASHSTKKIDGEILVRMVEMKIAHDKWEPQKLLELLRIENPSMASPSTTAQQLNGLIGLGGPVNGVSSAGTALPHNYARGQ